MKMDIGVGQVKPVYFLIGLDMELYVVHNVQVYFKKNNITLL
jgi:hypothetical protein